MINAIEIGPSGKVLKEHGADSLTKAEFKTLAAEQRLICPCCGGGATHVAATRVDGGFLRSAHFRADHSEGCLHIDDPRSAERAISFKQAIANGTPILVNINLNNKDILGFDGLTPLFNTQAANPKSGLMSKEVFEKHVAPNGHLSVPAHDITDVLYYLEMAKELGGQSAMNLLYFNTLHAVQSCQRFVVADTEKAVGRVVSDMAMRAPESAKAMEQRQKRRTSYPTTAKNRPRKPRGFITDTPRLFLFKPTQAQIRKAEKEELHTLYGQLVDADIPAYGQYTALKHLTKVGMRLKGGKEALSNRTVLNDGRSFWVLAVPALDMARGFEIRAKIRRERFTKVDLAFLFLRVKDRRQYIAREDKATAAPNPTPAAPKAKTAAKPVADEPYQRPANDWRLRADLQ